MAVVVDRARAVKRSRGADEAGVLEQSVAVCAEVVGPGEGAAARERPEALEVAGAKSLRRRRSAAWTERCRPPQLAQLRCGEELVAPDVADDRDVARLDGARHDAVAAVVLDGGAVVAVRVDVARAAARV